MLPSALVSASTKRQVEGNQYWLRIGTVDGGNADPIHILAAVLKDQVRITFDLPSKVALPVLVLTW